MVFRQKRPETCHPLLVDDIECQLNRPADEIVYPAIRCYNHPMRYLRTYPMPYLKLPVLAHVIRPALFTGMLLGMIAAPFCVAAAADPSTPESALMTGEQVYNNVCIACHSPPGVGGAPALGDNEAWAPRLAQGIEILNDHALNGFSGKVGVMPKKGERLDLSDEETIRAVAYMIGQLDQSEN